MPRCAVPSPVSFDTSQGDDPQAYFEDKLSSYQRIVHANLMFHREVYGLLRKILITEASRPFSLIDVACGDAAAMAQALTGLDIGRYDGIDLSPASLVDAKSALAQFPCPVTLHCRDFVDALDGWERTADVVWIGMSLHHLQTEQKGALMRTIRRIVGNRGLFLIWEPTLAPGESRNQWCERFSALRPAWAQISDAEFSAMEAHVRAADFPETAETWRALGTAAGFRAPEHLLEVPNGLATVLRFRPT
jgi:hypothetical protein